MGSRRFGDCMALRRPHHSSGLSRMAFNLKKVLKALLLSSSQPLAIKDIQAAFTRFHDTLLPLVEPGAATPTATDAAENGEISRELSNSIQPNKT